MNKKSVLIALFCIFGLTGVFAQNVPTQKRTPGTVNLDVMSFNADSTYEKVKKQLDDWKIEYDDADLF